MNARRNYPNDPILFYADRVRDLEGEGLSTSDAQAAADAEFSQFDPRLIEQLMGGAR